jgi:hypothetical protein
VTENCAEVITNKAQVLDYFSNSGGMFVGVGYVQKRNMACGTYGGEERCIQVCNGET